MDLTSASLTICLYKEDMLDDGCGDPKIGFSAKDWDDEELGKMEDCRPVLTQIKWVFDLPATASCSEAFFAFR